MSIATNLAALARRVLSDGTLPPSAVSSLSAQLSSTGTDLIINGLDADTLYNGVALFTAALDGAVGWQSRTVPGGAWDAGASDYNSQVFTGFGSSSSVVATNNAHGQMGTVDAGSVAVPALVRFTLYTGSASRQAMVNSSAGYITTDGASIVTGALMSRRVVNGAIADIRFLNVAAANGLAAGSRVLLRRVL